MTVIWQWYDIAGSSSTRPFNHAIGCHRMPSDAIGCHRMPSDAIVCCFSYLFIDFILTSCIFDILWFSLIIFVSARGESITSSRSFTTVGTCNKLMGTNRGLGEDTSSSLRLLVQHRLWRLWRLSNLLTASDECKTKVSVPSVAFWLCTFLSSWHPCCSSRAHICAQEPFEKRM